MRICGHARCAAITDRNVLRALSSFVYGERLVTRAAAVRAGAAVFELRFRNGYVVGLVGPARLDRFLSFGVICGRFHRGRWYRLPKALTHELRALAAPLEPARVPRVLPRSC